MIMCFFSDHVRGGGAFLIEQWINSLTFGWVQNSKNLEWPLMLFKIKSKDIQMTNK